MFSKLSSRFFLKFRLNITEPIQLRPASSFCRYNTATTMWVVLQKLPQLSNTYFSQALNKLEKNYFHGFILRPWSSWTANSDKKLNVNKPCMTSRKTAFAFLKLSSFLI